MEYKGKGEHSVKELEQIIEAQAEELHLFRSGQKTASSRFPHMETHEVFDLPAPNTVMWWLCRIADPEIRRKAVNEFYRSDWRIEAIVDRTVHDALNNAFDWEKTEDGHSYWNLVYKYEIPLLSEPDFKEYNELRK